MSENNNKINNNHEDGEENTPVAGCGIFGRYPLITLITFAAAGIATGVGLSFWDDEDGDSKDATIKWIGLLGDLFFIRALKCLVLPLIFVSVTLAVLEMMAIGRAGSVGWKTSKSAALFGVQYLTCTVCARLFFSHYYFGLLLQFAYTSRPLSCVRHWYHFDSFLQEYLQRRGRGRILDSLYAIGMQWRRHVSHRGPRRQCHLCRR